MSRTAFFDSVLRGMRLATMSNRHGLSLGEIFERRSENEAAGAVERRNRREFLADLGRLALSGGVVAAGAPVFARGAAQSRRGPSVNVGIVGAGLAGLACADQLSA